MLEYLLDPEIFKHWGVIGDLHQKLYIDTKEFLPLSAYLKEKFADMSLRSKVIMVNLILLKRTYPSLIQEKVKQKNKV